MRKSNKEYITEYKKRCLNKDPKLFHIRNNFRTGKYRAKRIGVPFTITLDYILNLPSEICPIFQTPLEWGTGTDLAGSLDRRIPELGYVPGNVAWISRRANTIKRDATLAELELIYEWLKQVS